MRNPYRYLMLLPALMCWYLAGAQVTIQPLLPQAGLVMKSQLWNISAACLIPGGADLSIELTVTDRVTGEPFITATATPARFIQGPQVFTEATVGTVTYVGGTSGWETSGLLPAGLYRACYRVMTISQKAELLAEECLSVDVEPMAPPMLVFPEDSAVLDTRYPQFLWLPPAPLAIFDNLQYELNVVEILPGQSAQEAVQRNMPVYNMAGLQENLCALPASFSVLDTGRYYAWQVVARNGQSYGAKSEAWVFRVREPVDSLPQASAAFLQLSANGVPTDVFEARGNTLFIKYYSYEAEYTAPIRILGAGGQAVRRTGRRVVYGDNYLAVKLGGAVSDGQVYTLEIMDGQGKPVTAQFTTVHE